MFYSTFFLHTITQTARLSIFLSVWYQNVYFDFLYKFCLKHFSFWEELVEIGEKCILVFTQSTLNSCQFLINFEYSRKTLERYLDTKFHENPYTKFHGNPYGGSRVAPCGQTDRQTRRNSFRSFANAPNKHQHNTKVKGTRLLNIRTAAMLFFEFGKFLSLLSRSNVSQDSMEEAWQDPLGLRANPDEKETWKGFFSDTLLKDNTQQGNMEA